MTPSVGVVVLNWNGWRDTLECLASLAAAVPGPARVVVVDNGSSDDSVEQLRRAREVKLLVSPHNLGFAGGNNLGLDHLRQDPSLTHFLLLNNDATVALDYFARLGQAIEAFPDAALLSGTIYYATDRDRVWYAGGRIVPWRGTVRHGVQVPAGPEPCSTGFVSGCAMVVSRRALDVLGPLPECYHLYWEDAEYSTRAIALGLSLIYAPRVAAYHKISGSASTAALRARYLYAWHRNRGVFVRRNLTGWVRAAALAYLAVVKPGHATWRALIGKPREGWATLTGTVAGLAGPLP